MLGEAGARWKEMSCCVTHHDKADKKRVAPALIGAVVIDTEVAEQALAEPTMTRQTGNERRPP